MEPSIQNYRHGATLPTLFASVGAEQGEYGLRAAGDLGTMRDKLRQPITVRSATAGLRSRPLAEKGSREAQRRGSSTKPMCAEVNRNANVARAVVCTRKIGFYRLTLELSGRCRDKI
jgi:hypothetical protein